MASSRWGSFLQQAVAGVESRLDNILAEGIDEQQPATTTHAPSSAVKKNTSGDTPVRTASTNSNRANDRLQERLARAIAAKNAKGGTGDGGRSGEGRPDSLALSSGVPSRTGSPATVADTASPRASLDVPLAEKEKVVEEKKAGGDGGIGSLVEEKEAPAVTVQPATPAPIGVLEHNGLRKSIESPRPSGESVRSSLPRQSMEYAIQTPSRSSVDITVSSPSIEATAKTPADYEAQLKALQAESEAAELQRQEEIHGYIERIDTLQSKLQYLARESAESAKAANEAAQPGSLERKIADKEQQVALLMEEGQSLSKKEINHLATIKKLRAKIQEDGKEMAEVKRKQEVAQKDVIIVTERWRKAQASERLVGEKSKLIAQLQRDIEMLKAENGAKDTEIRGLKAQLEEATSQAELAERRKAQEALEVEKKRAKELEDDISNLKIEKSLVSDRAQAQIKELREEMDKDAERARMVELEMKSEQQMLESKLEVMRARAEEVSSGATGDAQAKLLRQIETLQSQYAVASENWQGIEASLIARATNLEKERDEAAKREADIRRKAREVTLKAKRNEDELEESRLKLPTFQLELSEHKTKLEGLQKRAEEAEAALIAAKAEFDQEKQTWRLEAQHRLEEEKQKWQDESNPASATYSRAESPVMSTRRGLTSEFLGLQNLQMRRASARSITTDLPPTGNSLLHRRPSIQPLRSSSGNGTPTRQDSSHSFDKHIGNENSHSLNSNNVILDTQSIHTDHDDRDRDFFESPSDPHRAGVDLTSISTTAAGPSVQVALVERMSSAVRRLESEKVASKEDMQRLAAQRDEARAEIVALMREVEGRREVDKRLGELERELQEVRVRYDASLEMLGEKSEEVEELRGDVGDLKAMYRELVERSVK